MGLITRLIGTAIGVFFRAIFTGLVMALLAVGGTALISSQYLKQWPPQPLTYIVGGLITLLAAYAGGITVLFRAITSGVLTVAKDVEKDVERAV